MLVIEEGECWFDLLIIVEYIELMNVVLVMLLCDLLELLWVCKIEVLVDGIMDVGLVLVCE